MYIGVPTELDISVHMLEIMSHPISKSAI